MLGHFLVAVQLAASRERLSTKKLVKLFSNIKNLNDMLKGDTENKEKLIIKLK
jgi:hypothetical protein